jgi:hypothetical protein
VEEEVNSSFLKPVNSLHPKAVNLRDECNIDLVKSNEAVYDLTPNRKPVHEGRERASRMMRNGHTFIYLCSITRFSTGGFKVWS